MIFDLGWCGGITEALEIQQAIKPNSIQVAYHDCTGPVSLAVAAQLSVATPHTVVQEFARSFWHTWYQEMATGAPDIINGSLVLNTDSGHGVTLRDEFLRGPHTIIRTSSL